MAVSFFVWTCWIALDLIRTKLFGWIRLDHPRNAETLHLRLKLLHLLLVHLPPPAEEVHVLMVVRLPLRVDHQAVRRTLRVMLDTS